MSKTKVEAPRRRLGRGLGSLLGLGPEVPVEVPTAQKSDKPAAPPKPVDDPAATPPSLRPPPTKPTEAPIGQVTMIEIKLIRPSPYQPRTNFDEAGLDSLAASIRTAGVMQPIIVRPQESEGAWEIVAGERRWRAAQKVGLAKIPAIVRPLDDHTAAEWALVENLQREDLNPIEQAEAFSTLINRFGLTHQDVADRVGLDRSTVSNSMRLLELDESTRNAVRSGRLSAGHARALLSLNDVKERLRLSLAAMQSAWSVRELENRCRQTLQAAISDRPIVAVRPSNAHLADLQKRLSEHLGTKVRIQPGRKKGSGIIEITFYDLDQFDGLMKQFGYEER